MATAYIAHLKRSQNYLPFPHTTQFVCKLGMAMLYRQVHYAWLSLFITKILAMSPIVIMNNNKDLENCLYLLHIFIYTIHF